ncbi:glycosyltransferase family 2 protein [Paraflavisolibacter sp. H34]|uniref:glycosyltransferase family 2 protein n=1 Tax=Huijunlia imazamoxiresistens TaxID=3127457 RepID=UPI00301B2EBD
MKLFVIIVTYNGARWMESCLGCLRTSTVPVVPVVVDNDSTDNTVEVIETSFPEAVLIRSKENLGFGKANNIGIEYALRQGADYLFLLNQDAWIFPDTLEHMVAVHQKHPEYHIISPLHLDGTLEQLDDNFAKWISAGDCPGLLSDLAVKGGPVKEVYGASFVNAALWLLPRECAQVTGGFNPLFRHYGEDNNFVHRVLFHGYKLGVCPGARGVHDRRQGPFDWGRMPLKSRLRRRQIASLIPLMNVKESFAKCLGKAASVYLKFLLKDAAGLKVGELLLDVGYSLGLLLRLPQVLRNRARSKQRNGAFLDLPAAKKAVVENAVAH